MAAAGYGQLNLAETPLWGSRNVDCFEKLEQIGEGTYGEYSECGKCDLEVYSVPFIEETNPIIAPHDIQVYMARDIKTGEIVALKKIRMDNEKEGFPITALREIKILKKLQHENVIKLKEIVISTDGDNKYKGDIYMVFEYMDHDLTGLGDHLSVFGARPEPRFTIPQIKCYMKQLLKGLHYCHINHVLHRDIKSSNLLINNEGNLKLADFGLARSYSNDHSGNLTNRVITLWYRPPELLLGATKYGPAVDMWSAGCIFAELLLGKPFLPGKDEPEQLNKIFERCGSPDEINWPGVSRLPWYNKFKPSRPMKRRVWELFRQFDSHTIDLLEKMLILDPSQRISAKDALDAEYFWTDPLPCDPKSLPKYEPSHEFQTKRKRRDNEEMAKRQKVQHPQQQQHSGLPPPIKQTGQAQWTGPNHLVSNSQPLLSTGPSHHQYANACGPAGGNPEGRYYADRGGQQGGGLSNGLYPAQGRGPQLHSGVPASGSRGVASGGNGVDPRNYSQSGQYGGPGAGRGPNHTGHNRNQQYGWQ